MKCSGVARNYETAGEAAGVLFGNNNYNFILFSDDDIDLPDGKRRMVGIRLESFVRVPSFDGLKVDIEGDYDSHETVFRARRVFSPETKLLVYGAKRLDLLSALGGMVLVQLAAIVAIIVVLMIWGLIVGATIRSGDAPPLIMLILGATVTAIVLSIGVFFALVAKSMYVPPLNEAADRLARKFLEDREP